MQQNKLHLYSLLFLSLQCLFGLAMPFAEEISTNTQNTIWQHSEINDELAETDDTKHSHKSIFNIMENRESHSSYKNGSSNKADSIDIMLDSLAEFKQQFGDAKSNIDEDVQKQYITIEPSGSWKNSASICVIDNILGIKKCHIVNLGGTIFIDDETNFTLRKCWHDSSLPMKNNDRAIITIEEFEYNDKHTYWLSAKNIASALINKRYLLILASCKG